VGVICAVVVAAQRSAARPLLAPATVLPNWRTFRATWQVSIANAATAYASAAHTARFAGASAKVANKPKTLPATLRFAEWLAKAALGAPDLGDFVG
jgi:hypothetical protein